MHDKKSLQELYWELQAFRNGCEKRLLSVTSQEKAHYYILNRIKSTNELIILIGDMIAEIDYGYCEEGRHARSSQ